MAFGLFQFCSKVSHSINLDHADDDGVVRQYKMKMPCPDSAPRAEDHTVEKAYLAGTAKHAVVKTSYTAKHGDKTTKTTTGEMSGEEAAKHL